MATNYPTKQELFGLPVDAAQLQIARALCEKNSREVGSGWSGPMHSLAICKAVSILFDCEMTDPRIVRLQSLDTNGFLGNCSQFGAKYDLRPKGGKLSGLVA